jgi:hypothetical protein
MWDISYLKNTTKKGTASKESELHVFSKENTDALLEISPTNIRNFHPKCKCFSKII